MSARLSVIAALVFAASSAGAQQQANPNAQCPVGTTSGLGVPDQQRATLDACQKSIDLFEFMSPQLGAVLAGGAPTLGQGGTLGGFGHFTLGLRVNAINGHLPQIQDVPLSVTASPPPRSTFPTKKQIIPLPVADLAVGLFSGIPLGVTNVGGLDLLVSATYLPSFDGDQISVDVDGSSVKFGFGARLGLIQESLLVPGVAVSYLKRALPTVNISARSSSDSLLVRNLSVGTSSWRVVASKSLFMFGVAVGGGKDRYESSTSVTAKVAARTAPPSPAGTAGPIAMSQEMTRTNMFLNVSFNLPFFKLVGEIGQAGKGKGATSNEVQTYNQFEGSKADDSRTFGSIGVRIGF